MVAILANSSTISPDIETVTSILNTATEIQEELSPETQVINGHPTEFIRVGEIMTDQTKIPTQVQRIPSQVLYHLSYLEPAILSMSKCHKLKEDNTIQCPFYRICNIANCKEYSPPFYFRPSCQ